MELSRNFDYSGGGSPPLKMQGRDDSDTYDVPWTAVMQMVKTEADVYEFACHEGNYAMPLMLKGARKQEQAGSSKEDDTWLPSWSKPRT